MSADDFVFSTLIARHPDPATASRGLQLAEAAVLRRAADAISALPQDYECDPGRGDAVERLRRTAEGIEEKASATAPTATPELLPKADVVAWLTKKARELRSAGGPVRAAQADAVAALASKVDRGAIRPDNLRMLPADFFEPGHTYSDTAPGIDWKFRVDHITTHPGNGELAALGWRHFKGEWQPIAHFADDWELNQHVGHTAVEKSSREATATPADTNRRARLLHEIALDDRRWTSGDVVRWYRVNGHTGLGLRAARFDLAVLRDAGALIQHEETSGRSFTHNSLKGGA